MFEFKKGNLIQTWKTEQMDKEISTIAISESNKKINSFCASGHSIRGINKKGKEFFKFDTNHTEDIQNLYVDGSNLWSSGDYILNSYKGTKSGIEDNFYYLSDDKIYDMLVANVSGSLVFNSVLACDDSSVRVLNESDIYYSQNFNSPVLSIHDSTKISGSSTPNIAYGLKNGSFGMIDMQRDSPLILWDVNETLTSSAPINKIYSGKLIDDGDDNDIIIAREDGSLEIYSFNEGEKPYQKYCLNFQESIVGIGIGNISRTDYKEIVVSLFSGKVAGLLDSNAEDIIVDQKNEEEQKSKKKLIDKYEQKKVKDTNTFTGAGIVGFKARYNFILVPSEAAYQLMIESQTEMSILMIQSNINIDILDEDEIPAVVSFSDNDSGQFIATFRMNEPTNNIVLKVRASEGLHGSINAFIIPHKETSKICKRLDISILPLGLHEKISNLPNTEDLELSSITFTGTFTQKDVLSWISGSLPNVPKVYDQEQFVLYYKSTFVGTYLKIAIMREKCVISSNNLSALTILRKSIASEANSKGKQYEISSEIADESVETNLSLIHPKLEEQYKLARNVQLIDGLKELQMQEEDLNFLSDEYKEILGNAEKIKKSFESQPRKLHFLWGIIADLYNDIAIIKGIHDVSGQIPKLKQILNNYDFDELVQFFKLLFR
ncbi:unnamed protein product [Moneuplotes crassus]|uniref:Uncharacterized protein n=1 Tax=Euplotes crassus TaxID=5936 RepID=A0AAD1X6E5_EUPCR|nr:unnamed protein product [Moneuplotes crassus]